MSGQRPEIRAGIVVLAGAPSLHASAGTDLAARADRAFVKLPASAPELDPVEECLRQLHPALSNRFLWVPH